MKAADALKIIELKHKFFLDQTSKEDLLQPLLEMFERAGKQAGQPKEGGNYEK